MTRDNAAMYEDRTIPSNCITATQTIGDVEYVVVLKPDGFGRYREIDHIPAARLVAEPSGLVGLRGQTSRAADPSVYVG